MELQETSMTRICEPRTCCYRSAERALGLGLLWRWFSRRGNSPGVVPCCHRFKPWAHGFGRPMVATGGGGGHWQWDCQHRGWHEEVKFKCCYFWDNPSFLSSWNHLELCQIVETFHEFYMVLWGMGFLEPRKGLKRSDWPSQKPTNSWGRRAGSWCIPSRFSHNFRGSQAVWIF